MGGLNLPLVLRNAIVLAVSAGLAELFQLSEGVFLVLAALMTLEGSIGQGLVAGRERIVGTFCGSAVCLLVLGVLHWQGVPAAGLGLGLVRVMGHSLGLASGFIVGGHVVAGSVAHHTADWPVYVAQRSFETILGVLAGVLAARWILPVRASRKLQLAMERWRGDLADALRQPCVAPGRLTALRGRRDQLLDQLRFAREELPAGARGVELARQWDRQLFHGSALLGCLRDLEPLEPAVSPDLEDACRVVQRSSADRLEGAAAPDTLRQACRRLSDCCTQLDRQGETATAAAMDDLALRLHRTQLIGHHAEAYAGAGSSGGGTG